MKAQRGLRRLIDVFPEVAAREEWGIEAVDANGRPGLLALIESYCVEPSCDCRRAVIEMVWVRERAGAERAASIIVDLRPARRMGEPIFELHPDGPRGRDAIAACEVLDRTLEHESGYVEMLRAHYDLMKAGPRRERRGGRGGATAGGAKVTSGSARGREASGARASVGREARRANRASEASGGREARRANRASEATGAGTQVAMVAAKVAKGEGKVQRRFRKVMAIVDGLRKRVNEWRARRPEIESRIAGYTAAVERQHEVMREMVLVLDDRFAHPSLAKKERRRVSQVICVLALELLEHGGHEELTSIYNRHARRDFAQDAARADEEHLADIKAELEADGIDFGDADVSTREKLTEFMEAELRAADAEEQRRKEKAEERRARKQTKKQKAAEDARAEEQRRTEKTLQEVYRGLAMSLHPDRERDPVERARKTELMRDVNVAYEARDLLRLLELELVLERVDSLVVDAMAEERLVRYCRILDEQARQLEDELAAMVMPYWMAIGMELGQGPRGRLEPEDVIARIDADVAAVEERTGEIARDLEIFREPALLKQWLKRRTPPRWDRDPYDGEGDDEQAEADAAFFAMFG